MSTNPKPAYRRVLLKLSGEALQGSEGFGIDPAVLERMAQEIKELVELGVQVGLVIGGGNLFRGAGLAKAGMNRVVGDHMGMMATVTRGSLGMTLSGKPDATWGLKLLYFLMVGVPSVLLAFCVILKSKRLSDFLDALADERLSPRSKSVAAENIFRKRTRPVR